MLERGARRSLLAVAVLAVSILPHLKGISSPLLDYHYHRQANTAAIAKNFHEDGLPLLRPRVDWMGSDRARVATELPLYMWLVGLLWPLFGLHELWGRVLSALCSAATALLLFDFLERSDEGFGWLETGPAFMAAVFFGLLPVEVYFGRTVQPESFALLNSVAALWALDRWLAAPRWSMWVIAAATAGFAIGHKLPYAYLLGVMAALAWARRGWAALRSPALWALFGGAAAIVVGWYAYASSSSVHVVPTGDYGTLLEYNRLPYFFFYQVFSRQLELAITYPGLPFFLAGAAAIVSRRMWFLAAWWACVLFDLLACGAYAFHHEYTALSWAPANAAVMGLGFWNLWQGASKARRLLLWALLAAMPAYAAARIGHWYRISFPYLLTLRPAVDRISRPDDLFLCNERAFSVPLFYIGRRGWAWDLDEWGTKRLPEVDKDIARGAKFFLTEKRGSFLNPDSPIASYFKRFPVVYEDAQVKIYRLSRP